MFPTAATARKQPPIRKLIGSVPAGIRQRHPEQPIRTEPHHQKDSAAIASHLNTVIHGDCLHALPKLPAGSVDFVLVDPPYLASYTSRDGRRVPNDDNSAWLNPAFSALYRVLRRAAFAVSFYGWPHADKFQTAYRQAGFRIVGHFVFPKRYTSSTRYVRYQHEAAYLLAKGDPAPPAYAPGDVIDWTYTGNKLHPTQKPVSVLLPLIEAFSKPGDVVLDSFCGSGSTLVAARQLGRSYIGIELCPKYHAIAIERLRSGNN
jgi:site-specific DNA-methyltransferase (adenine-specific)